MSLVLDHLLWGVPDLDDGVRRFTELTGVTPATGGTHPGHGTRNKLVSLSPEVFFELIAPDPDQERPAGSRGAEIAAMPHPGLITFAVQTHDIEAACGLAVAAGLTVTRRTPMSRTRPDGVRLEWTIAHFAHPSYGAAIPFAIDWQGSPHPAATSPGGCRLRSFTVLHPEPAGLAEIYRGMGIAVPVQGALKPGFIAELDTPRGDVRLLQP